jgi:hypothetical protein
LIELLRTGIKQNVTDHIILPRNTVHHVSNFSSTNSR